MSEAKRHIEEARRYLRLIVRCGLCEVLSLTVESMYAELDAALLALDAEVATRGGVTNCEPEVTT